MNVVSNSRFTEQEFSEWKDSMRDDRCVPLSQRAARRRKDRMRTIVPFFNDDPNTRVVVHDEQAVKRLVEARNAGLDFARYKVGKMGTVKRINHGHKKTQLEHAACAARDAYLAVLVKGARALDASDGTQPGVAQLREARTTASHIYLSIEH